MIEVRLLGQFDVRLNGAPVEIPTRPAQSLLAYLLLNPGTAYRREKLAGLFWPDATEANARGSLRQALARIRKALEAGRDCLLADDLAIAFDASTDYWLDVAVLDRKGIDAGSTDDLISAVSVYEGELLPGFYDGWVSQERERLLGVFESKMRLLLDRLVAEQRWPDVLEWSERWIALGQTPEPAYRALMHAHAGLGDMANVVKVYQRCLNVLVRELGVDPSPDTRAVYERILRGEKSAVRGYELRERIGQGELGAVYRAYQPLVGREVAIKVIFAQYANHPDFIRRFESEAQLIARLEHPHIRPLYDYWREPDGAYLVMRWLSGGSLRRALQRGPLTVGAAARLVDQVAAALAAAHRHGVVHGALKPDDILFDEEGNAYLGDFAIAKDVGTATDLAPGYLAPEQVGNGRPTPWSDQYSLGLILLEALTVQKPFPDLPAEVSAVIRRATAQIPAERYPDALALAAAFRAALLTGPPLAPPTEKPAVANPYKGLRAFQEADAPDFFGREALVERLLARLQEPVDTARFLAVVGPSGCGKTSVVKAGLLPALRRGALPGSDKWFVVEISPAAYPLDDVEIGLLRIAVNPPAGLREQLRRDARGLLRAAQLALPTEDSELLLIVDQFEEVFTLAEDKAESAHFLSSLFAAVTDPRSRVRVILALRADYYDRPLLHLDFGNLIRQRTEVVVPMTVDEIRRAVVAPAERAGVSLEPGLDTTIVAQVSEQPSALPLLQYALTQLFERREGQLLTKEAYQAIGGVPGALTWRAEAVYADLDAAGKAAARQLFLRLVALGEGMEDSRRRVLQSELTSIAYDAPSPEVEVQPGPDEWPLDPAGIPSDFAAARRRPDAMDAVIKAFEKSRLLIFDRDPVTRAPTVEIAHEALLQAWGQLRDWLDASRADLRHQRLLAQAAAEWLNAQRDPSCLLHGARLDRFTGWAAETELALTHDERAFLEASLAREKERTQSELEAAKALAEAQRRRAQERLEALGQLRTRDRIIIVGGVMTVTLALAAGLLFSLARGQAAVAVSRHLAAECSSLMNSRFDLAALLCVEALRFADTIEARGSLITALANHSQVLRYLHGHRGSVASVAFSPDGTLLASGGADGRILLWDTTTRQSIGLPLAGHAGAVSSIAFSPDGRLLASGGADGLILLWDVTTRQSTALPTRGGAVRSIALSPDGRLLASGSSDGLVTLWDIKKRRPAGVLQGHTDAVRSLAFSRDGKALGSGSGDNTIRVWDITTGESRTLTGHSDDVIAVSFRPDGSLLASGSADNSVIPWDRATGESVGRLLKHTNWVYAVAFSPDGERLASGSVDKTVLMWDAAARQAIGAPLAGHASTVNSVAFSPDGKTLASASDDATILLWDVSVPKRTHMGAVTSVAFSPDGKTLASGSADNNVLLWDVALRQPVGLPLTGHSDGVTSVAISPDQRTLASAGRDASIILWDIATRQPITLAGHRELVTSLAFSPDGKVLASGSTDNTVILWDVKTGRSIGSPLTGHTDWVYAVAFHPDGKTLASGSRDNTIRLWDVKGQTLIGQPLTDHLDWVYSVAFSPDGKRLASGGADNAIYLWDVTRQPVVGQALQGHTNYVFSVGFSPDGKTLASGSADTTVILWDVKTGQPIGEPLTGHTGAVYSVSFSPNGTWLASGSYDATYRLWNLAWQARACDAAGRNLTQAEWEQALRGQTFQSYLVDLTYHPTCEQWPAGD